MLVSRASSFIQDKIEKLAELAGEIVLKLWIVDVKEVPLLECGSRASIIRAQQNKSEA